MFLVDFRINVDGNFKNARILFSSLDFILNDHRISLLQKPLQLINNLIKRDLLEFEQFDEFRIAVDDFAVVRLLQPVRLDILPQRANDVHPRIFLNAEDLRQRPVQLELLRIVVEVKPHLQSLRRSHRSDGPALAADGGLQLAPDEDSVHCAALFA